MDCGSGLVDHWGHKCLVCFMSWWIYLQSESTVALANGLKMASSTLTQNAGTWLVTSALLVWSQPRVTSIWGKLAITVNVGKSHWNKACDLDKCPNATEVHGHGWVGLRRQPHGQSEDGRMKLQHYLLGNRENSAPMSLCHQQEQYHVVHGHIQFLCYCWWQSGLGEKLFFEQFNLKKPFGCDIQL